MGRLFGTDGVRGVAGRDLTARLAMDLAIAGAGVLSGAGAVAGLASSGVDVLRLGVLPTPGVAYLVKALDAD
ncbi:MAG TPA: phosphoglucosamine mutase, partial [Streptosporangiaceae bacterium]|nr:phosphoglucosamine mutase [Streptosporangiaceae bacterium]